MKKKLNACINIGICLYKRIIKKIRIAMNYIMMIVYYMFISKNNGVNDTTIDKAFEELNSHREYKELNVYCENQINPIFDLMIVLPVYNNEKYLEKCLNSLVEQKTKYTFHIVAVNDGSTDNSGLILENYAKRFHSAISIITQKNGGHSSARNAALKNICAKYIMFVDSDDELFNDEAIEKLMSIAIKNNADIVEGGYAVFDDNNPCYYEFKHKNNNSYKDQNISILGYTCMKVINSCLFKNIEFPEGFLFEDSIMAYCIEPNAKKIYTIPDIVYKYRSNQNGISKTVKNYSSSIDTYYVTKQLWNYYYDRFNVSYKFKIKAINQMILNYNRTILQSEKVLSSGFIIQAQDIKQFFGEQTIKVPFKYLLMYKCILKCDYTTFKKMIKIWPKI